MLQIGQRIFDSVLTRSGFHVSLDPIEHRLWSHTWRLDAHFVPADEDYCPGPDPRWEYWRFFINPLGALTVKDWRELARGSFYEGEEVEVHMGAPSLEDMIERLWGGGQRLGVGLGEFSVIKREGYLFTIEADGEILPGKDEGEDALTGDFRLRAEIPFASATVHVPLNAGDPLASAKAIAAREIQLTEFARTHVTLFDPERKVWKPARSGKHTVTLETPWRV